MRNTVARGILWSILLGAAWLTMASALFVWLAGLWDVIPAWHRPWQWIVYARLIGRSYSEMLYLALSAIGASIPFFLYLRHLMGRVGGLRLRSNQHKQKVIRGTSDNHGHADYMGPDEIRTIFKTKPHSEYGGLAIGEMDRVDLGPSAGMPFNSWDEKTWAGGGKAEVMYDHCDINSTHGAIIGGSGTYKTWRLIAAMLSWKASAFCVDPTGEIADRVGEDIEASGRRVVTLNIGGSGPNVLAGIDPRDPLADTFIDAIIGRISGPSSGDNKSDKFAEWGKEILKAFLCHIIYDPSFLPEERTLRTLREALEGDDDLIRNRLCGIAEASASRTARSLAATWHDKVKETFDGALLNATGVTAWLASDAYSGLVCDGAYDMREITDGKLVIFCQLPQWVLDHKSVVARVLTGCHIDTVILADGAVDGRVWVPIDEAVLMGQDPSLRTVLNQGRKFKITMWLLYQSEWQVSRIWGADGREEFYDSLAWRQYTSIRSLKSARELSDVMGTYGVRATSSGSNTGKSGGPFQIVGTKSKGENTNEHDISKKLGEVYELLTEMRGDETLTVVGGRKVIRHRAILPFWRPDLWARCNSTRHESNSIEQAFEAAD